MAADFKRLPGKARRYLEVATGRELSDRQVRELRAQAAGGGVKKISREKLSLERKIFKAITGQETRGVGREKILARLRAESFQDTTQLMNRFAMTKGAKRGGKYRPATMKQVARSAEFWDLLGTLTEERKKLSALNLKNPKDRKRAEKLRGPNSPLARALVELGLRDPNATYLVGESPRAKRPPRPRKMRPADLRL